MRFQIIVQLSYSYSKYISLLQSLLNFFNHWIKHSNFMKLVDESWKGLVFGDPMSALFQKMKRLKAELRRFNQAEFGNITAKLLKKEMS